VIHRQGGNHVERQALRTEVPMLQATFSVSRQILLDLGFTVRVEPGTFVRFDHARSNTVFVFRPHLDDEAVNLPNLVGARRILDEKGLLPAKEFEELLRQRLSVG
jgi:hypothetical protein